MEWHKSFEKQIQECKKDGKRWPLTYPCYTGSIIICAQFKTYCHIKACEDVRHGMSPVGDGK